jgi:hypothetical protein
MAMLGNHKERIKAQSGTVVRLLGRYPRPLQVILIFSLSVLLISDDRKGSRWRPYEDLFFPNKKGATLKTDTLICPYTEPEAQCRPIATKNSLLACCNRNFRQTKYQVGHLIRPGHFKTKAARIPLPCRQPLSHCALWWYSLTGFTDNSGRDGSINSLLYST